MARIPFDIKFRPQIESGEYKVETRDGRRVKIIYWDLNCTSPIVAVMDVHIDLPGEIVDIFSVSGMAFDDSESPSDLFIVTPEPELTEFEKALADIIGYAISQSVVEPNYETYKFVKDWSKRLLDDAKKELCKNCPEKQRNTYIYGDPIPHTWFPSCYHGGPCTNPMHDCINCPHQSTIGINTTTGTSTEKVDSHE